MRVGVKIVLDHPDAKIPVYAKSGDAGADVSAVPNKDPLYSPWSVVYDEKMEFVEKVNDGDYLVEPGKTILVDLGFRIELPEGWEMQVRPRSGMAKRGLTVANSPGTIDSGYRGPCMVLIHNMSSNTRLIRPGTRVAQFVIKQAPQAIFEQTLNISDTDRGSGGFGSTGTA